MLKDRKLKIVLVGVAFAGSLFMPAVPARASTQNLIANPSVETQATSNPNAPNGWYADSWGDNQTAFSYVNDGHHDSRSVYVEITDYFDGDAKWFFDPVVVEPNTSYSFSDYYQSSLWTDVLVQFRSTDGARSYRWIAGSSGSASWKQLAATFVTPNNVQSLTIFHMIQGAGWLQTDDFSLSAVAGNIMPNPSLEMADSATMPQQWTSQRARNNNATFSYLKSGHTGSHSVQVKIASYTDGDAYWAPTLQPVTGGETYEFADWYKSTAATNVYGDIVMQDGSEQWIKIGLSAVASADWNHFYTQFSMPPGAKMATIYHSLSAVGTLTTDSYQLNEFKPVGFERVLASLTFDDGIRTAYINGLPLLDKYGFKSTQFVISSFSENPYYMTAEMVKAFADQGHEIGSHTVTHPHLINASSSKLATELSKSQSDLLAMIGAQPTSFAAPYGEMNSAVLARIKQYYGSQRGVETGFNDKSNFDRYDIKVQDVTAATTTADVANWVNQASSQRTWLVLVFHAVDANSSTVPDPKWNTTPTQLDADLKVIKDSGITVKTINQALAEISTQL